MRLHPHHPLSLRVQRLHLDVMNPTKPVEPTSTPAARARYWHELEDGRIQCDVCPRFCKLREGQRGLCFVRAREGDEIVLTTYGRSSGFCVDPIEKKPLNHFLPGTPVLSFGTAGCNLTCKFCQNWDISKATEFDRLQDEASPAEIARAAQAMSARSVAFTYNDPVIFLEYAVDVARSTEFDRLQDEASPAEIARAAQAMSARSVAFTYNDPVIFLEYAVDVA